MLSIVYKFIWKHYRKSFAIAAAFLISFGWNWYHAKRDPAWKFALIVIGVWAAAYFSYRIGKFLYKIIIRRLGFNDFWHNEFYDFLDRLFFIASLLFVIFFLKSDLLSIGYLIFILLVLFFILDRQLSKHPNFEAIQAVNRGIFLIVFVLFALNSGLQYYAHQYNIFESRHLVPNTLLFRSLSITMIWMIGLSISGFISLRLSPRRRWIGFGVWGVLFAAVMLFWVINIGILYFSGLYVNPVAFEHAKGAGMVIWNWLSFLLLFGYALCLAAIIYVIRKILRAFKVSPRRYWYFYFSLILAAGILVLFSTRSFYSTPEYSIAKNFYKYFTGETKEIILSKELFGKLEKYGLFYKPEKFLVAQKDKIYSEGKNLLPDRLKNTKPNIVIIFVESLSARLVNTYNGNRFKDLTPNLDKMAADPDTTVFKNVYNASTPTITGTLAELCSYLPPTGHEEIHKKKGIREFRLTCLPKILKDRGYSYSSYTTAVSREFSSKDTIFTGMGVDEVFGKEDLAKIIQGEPLSWGYSDHQMFPVLFDMMENKSNDPFLMMLATVDLHFPYVMTKDLIKWENGRSDVLDAVHTTDDAFGIFWDKFKNSELAKNTIVAVIADHAIFPGGIQSGVFPEYAGKATFYDEIAFMMYVPDSVLPDKVETFSSSMDLAPTILHILGINGNNAFDGHSIFDDRDQYQNLVGMHEFGLFINRSDDKGGRAIDYGVPSQLDCPENLQSDPKAPLTLCELQEYYKWKRQVFEEGRLWNK